MATLVVIALFTASWVGLFSFLGAAAAYSTFSDLDQRYLPDTGGQDLALPDLSRVSRIFTEQGAVLAELHDGRNSQPIRLAEVPEHVRQAMLAAEDADFYEHEGIDFESIMRAAVFNARGGRLQGGSTITQQVIKRNIILDDDRTMERKIREAVWAAALEERYDKDQILEFYMNSVYFGWSAYGIKAAAEEYYGKEVARLTVAEAATLATLVRNPSLYDPRRRPQNAFSRRNDVLNTMVTHGFVTPEEGERAKRSPLGVIEHQASQEEGVTRHLVAAVKHELLYSPEFAFLGATYEERKKSVFGCPGDDVTCTGGGGLRVYVSIDLDLQQRAVDLLQTWLPQPSDPEADVPTGAIAAVDPRTGAVRVMASGLDFEEEQFDLARQGQRNPGSAFKAFALVAALESGISLRSFWDSSSPKRIDCGYPCHNGSRFWTVNNANRAGLGLISLADATRSSVNVVYAQVSLAVGPAKIIEVARRMGITSELPEVLSLALGTGAVSPLEMASAFGNLATNGIHAEPYLVERIVSEDGETLYQHETVGEQILDPALAAAARSALEQVVARGTARSAQIGRPQFGKTGTHQDYKDAWFVGAVPQLSTAVWVGYPDAQIPLTGVRINGTFYSRVFGGSVPAPIWRQFMLMALEGVPVEDFPSAEGTGRFFVVPRTEVPDVVGMLVDEAREEILDAHLSPVVEEVNSLEPVGTVLEQAPEGGASVAQGTAVTINVSTGLPPTAPLPDLVGMDQAQAEATLTQLAEDTGVALTRNYRTQTTTDQSQDGRVLSTSPGAGTEVTDGDTIQITLGQFVAPTTTTTTTTVPPPDPGPPPGE